jgi:hypothetical protein
MGGLFLSPSSSLVVVSSDSSLLSVIPLVAASSVIERVDRVTFVDNRIINAHDNIQYLLLRDECGTLGSAPLCQQSERNSESCGGS